MTPTEAERHFSNLLDVMEGDNGCSFTVSTEQRERAVQSILRMSAAGCGFPASEQAMARAASDLDGVYWTIVAGEETEAEEVFSVFDGYTELSEVLNEIFNGERT